MQEFDRPIPGQSLTAEPRNAPYERPPEIVDPETAIQVHLARLSDPEIMQDAMFFLESGLDIVSLTEGILRSAVMEGVHSIDVSLIAAPVIHEYIKSTADALGIKYEEGFEDKQQQEEVRYARNSLLAKTKMEEMGIKPQETAMEIESQPVEPVEQEEPMGLMSRRM